MSIILFGFIPLGLAMFGWLLGAAVSLTVPTEGGKQFGSALGRWCKWSFPGVYLLLFVAGGTGSAKDGVQLFGSAELFALLCLPLYAIPVLGLYVVVLYVVQDLLGQLRSKRSNQSLPNGR